MTMAVPFHWPTEEETEESYRRLDTLLRDLYSLLDVLLAPARPPPPPPDRPLQRHHHDHHHHHRNHPSSAASIARRMRNQAVTPVESTPEPPPPLPDVVASTLESSARPRDDKVLPPRPHRQPRRRTTDKEHDVKQSTINIGLNLTQSTSNIQVVEEGGEIVAKQQTLVETKATGLMSLLVPDSLSPTVWTTVLILVGWKILSRQRS